MDEARWQALSQHLAELFDMAPEEQTAYLAKIAQTDAAMADELTRLLAAEARDGLLDEGMARAAPVILNELAQVPASVASRAHRHIGPYRLTERIGSGGMGEVWRGEREGDFLQVVAIKLIRPLLDSPHLRERFARERRILARLEHPSIARLLDGGVGDDGTPWYAMEYVEGQDIVAHALQYGLTLRERVALMVQVCDAVAFAQAQLVVHRDLKPSNLLVDAQGRVRVLDFGIARLLDDSGDARLTSTDMRLFSPSYAAPEQIRGEAVGTAADVFALGAVLYELLTGQVPYPARSTSPARLLTGLENETLLRPSGVLRERTLSGNTTNVTARELEGDLDILLATALHADPARRYVGAAQLGDDLRRWLDGRPIAAQPDTASYRLSKFVTRHRLAVASAAAVLLALLIGLGAAVWQAEVAREHARRADAHAALARQEAARAEYEAEQVRAQVARTRKVKEFLVGIFVQADPMRRASNSPTTVPAAFDAALERARTELASDPVLQADVLDDFGEIRANQGRFDEAQALFEQAIAVARAEYGDHHPVLAESLSNLGVTWQFRGNPLAAEPYFEEAIAILTENDGGDPLALARLHNNLASVRQAQGRLAEAGDLTHRGLAVFRAHLEESDPQLAMLITNAATYDANADRADAAEAGFREAMRIVEKHQGPDSPHLWPNLTGLAGVLRDRNLQDEATAHYERALAIARKTYTTDHPWVAFSLIDVGWMNVERGDYEAGERDLAEAIAIHTRLNSPRVVSGLRRLGVSQARRGDLAAARATLQRGWDTCEASDQRGNDVCVVMRANLAHVLARSGEADTALPHADAAIAALSQHSGMADQKSQALRARATALTALDRTDEARLALDDAVALLSDAYGPDHPTTREAMAQRDTVAAHTQE